MPCSPPANGGNDLGRELPRSESRLGWGPSERVRMTETDPIRVFLEEGQWLVDYGSYARGFHATRDAAIQTATAAARSERRGLVVEPEA